MKDRLVIIGGGMAATRLVDEVTARAPDRYDITVIGEEQRLPYNRVLLSSLLAREVEGSDLDLKPRTWWEERGVTLVAGARATAIDIGERLVRVQSGLAIPYDALVLATGSEPVQLPLPGADLPGVVTFRTHDDVTSMLGKAGAKRRAVVIGGGLLGLEAAYGLVKAGAAVTVVHLADRLMERQLDARGAAMLTTALEDLGIEVLLEAESVGIEGAGRVERLRLADGTLLPADLIVMAAGIRPRTALARDAGLAVDRGIVVDDRMCTSADGIYALGECAEHRGLCYGLVEPAYEQAAALAAHLTGASASYTGSLLATNLKVSGVGVFSAGDYLGGLDTDQVVFSDPDEGSYRKLVLKDGHLTGAVLLGDTADGLWYLDLMRSGASLSGIRSSLIFGQAFCAESVSGPATENAEAA
ncbi:NAD(P)/FAD-dependent oxidoreductase [Methyloceanibacter caenitepidi]|nr:FAD-dependent oxidoreductase [Methyloceanibacter caenitepidi]